jgi:prepilin-type N-terminal cleavage/methylation domain-containing protein/prepilin-type processing-associated H-X9-DG protein
MRIAFTLIELLVVVAIVAVLAGMLMPALSAVKTAAQGTTCASNQRQLMLAVLAYTGDWDGFLPYGQIDAAAVPAWMTPGTKTWADSDRAGGQVDGPAVVGGAFASPSARRGVWSCPADRRRASVHYTLTAISYGINRQICGAETTLAGAEAMLKAPRSIAGLRRTSDLILLMDTQEARWTATNFPGTTTPATLAYSSQEQPSGFWGTSVQAPYSQFGRHRRAGNGAFADGHVAILPALTEDVLARRLFVRVVDMP